MFRAAFAGHVRQADVKMLGHALLDDLNVDGLSAFLVQDFAEQAFDHLNVSFLPVREAKKPRESARLPGGGYSCGCGWPGN